MTLLDDLHANQHDDLVLPADHALAAFLSEVNPAVARLDLVPRTDVEVRHFAHALQPTDWEIR